MSIGRTIIFLLVALFMASPVFGQAMERAQELTGSGFFRDQDTLPGSFRFYQQLPGGEAGLWGIGPSHPKIRRASFKLDAHDDVMDFSPQVRCQKCHQAADQGSARAEDGHQLRAVSPQSAGCRCLPVLLAAQPDPAPRLCLRQVPRGGNTIICLLHGARTQPDRFRDARQLPGVLLRCLVHADTRRRGVRVFPALHDPMVDTGLGRQAQEGGRSCLMDVPV